MTQVTSHQTNAPRAPISKREKPRLSVGFILAKRFTLCAFANFVDVLRLAADEAIAAARSCAIGRFCQTPWIP